MSHPDDPLDDQERLDREAADRAYSMMSPDLRRVLKGLRPDLKMVDGAAVGFFSPEPEHWGRTGWLHGGLAAAVLDHLCARAAASVLGRGVVTGYLDLRYPNPVLLAGGPYPLEARAETPRGRMVKVKGVIKDREGKVLVEAKAMFVKA